MFICEWLSIIQKFIFGWYSLILFVFTITLYDKTHGVVNETLWFIGSFPISWTIMQKHIIEMTERWKKLKNIGELFRKRTTINKYPISFSIFKKFLIIIKRKNLKYIINGIILARQERASVVYAVHDGEDHEKKMLPLYVRIIRSNKKGELINNITVYDY